MKSLLLKKEVELLEIQTKNKLKSEENCIFSCSSNSNSSRVEKILHRFERGILIGPMVVVLLP